ncbi:MAG: CinA family protein [Christensenellaceae bacterium]|nr:CinA family protein [Christensenellaceae bacterium]
MTEILGELVQDIFRLCRNKCKKIAVCESITGGLVVSALIGEDGASKCVEEGFITYSNDAKQNRLKVESQTLSKFGAVSAETAAQMCEGIWRDGFVTVSTTGNAGPTAMDGKPVGRVYVGVCCGTTSVYEFNFEGDRNQIRTQAATAALEILKTVLERV